MAKHSLATLVFLPTSPNVWSRQSQSTGIDFSCFLFPPEQCSSPSRRIISARQVQGDLEMSEAAVVKVMPLRSSSAIDIAREIGPEIERRSESPRDEDVFVADNFALLKEAGLFEIGVPRELGGGGASPDDLAEMLRILAGHCGSTALALAMHTHLVAVPAWRWHHQPAVRAAVEPLLKRLVAERVQLVSSGASDWIDGAGKAEAVDVHDYAQRRQRHLHADFDQHGRTQDDHGELRRHHEFRHEFDHGHAYGQQGGHDVDRADRCA